MLQINIANVGEIYS